MAAPTTIDEALAQNPLGPKSVTNTDGQSVVAKPAEELIAIDKHVGGKSLVRPTDALFYQPINPPGGSR